MSEAGPIIVKKKKVIAGGHHGGSWKVAYADFVTAMMAFFMVMWIMGMDAETRSMVAGYFNDPMGFIKNPPKSRTVFPMPGSPAPKLGQAGASTSMTMSENERLEADAMKSLQKKIENAAKDGRSADLKDLLENFEVTLTDEGLRLEFAESVGAVFFESGKAVIRPEAKQLIQRIAPILARSGRKMRIEGHTDALPYAGKDYTNLELSTDRAGSLRRELTADGVALEQVLSIEGLGASELKNKKDPYHFSNRRVTLLLPYDKQISKVQDLPADLLKKQIKAAFRTDIDVAPGKPDVSQGKLP
ncbi:MAG: OmpA family protein [Armatimonadetes bacterium]|nr:OmpA family protein [Armatimonadota bacterium]